MPKNVKVLILRTAGTNCDKETMFAFQDSGANVDLVHINALFEGQAKLSDYHILALPGGFSYGDDIAAGRILANELRVKLGKELRKFIDSGKLIIGICNGFQVLVKAGILPGNLSDSKQEHFSQTTTLMTNDSAKFEDRWTHLKIAGDCVWTKNMEDDVVYFPVAHGEGKFVCKSKAILNKIKNNRQIVFRYCMKNGNTPAYPDNPNGSVDHIAGITDPTGRVLGLMPHPERHFFFIQHPFWTRFKEKTQYGDGASIFQNGVNYVKENLL